MDAILEWWPVILAGGGGLVWLSRLEWQGLKNQADIKQMQLQRKEDIENSQRSRDETNKVLDEIRTDIKMLLGRVPRG